jgi:hypothetical protein
MKGHINIHIHHINYQKNFVNFLTKGVFAKAWQDYRE